MNLIVISILIMIAIILIALIIKENIDFKKQFSNASKMDYRTRLKSDLDIYEDEY